MVMSMGVLQRPESKITAVLGPTNTGKTHLAVERMLAYQSGMIGLPLRLLAREIYDRVVAARGPGRVALITGEEKITPQNPKYFICTVEAMPMAEPVEFLAVDEIQLCADGERGHIFTERLLHARGKFETMFLGADTMRPLIRKLLPETEFISRPRFSQLRFAGEKKLSRLPRRSAIVSFSANDVYAIAELVRRQRGGCAVVTGALSPRTRNAQVALYQSGEVDFLVATDAIGMGLNLDINHVAFAARRKFDGLSMRPLYPIEVGQIAGRAGRHMNDGSFGTTATAGAFSPEMVEVVESHRYDPLTRLQWRNGKLDFRDIGGLLHSLRQPPPRGFLLAARDADDVRALKILSSDPEIRSLAKGPRNLRQLWDICRIPDFRKTMIEQHHRLLHDIYLFLTPPGGRVSEDWLAPQVEQLARIDGDVDALSARIAHIRTWTYVANRENWLEQAEFWRGRTHEIEDQLSDALHSALAQRFVDRRSAALHRRLKERQELFGAVTATGDVLVEGQYVGRLEGLRFLPDTGSNRHEDRAIRAAANRILAREVDRIAAILAAAPDSEITWREDNRICWRDQPVARWTKGRHPLRPLIALQQADHLSGPLRERVRVRLDRWTQDHISRILAPLELLENANWSPAARGLIYQLRENLGAVERQGTSELLSSLSDNDRVLLRQRGVRLGYVDIYLPAMLKPRRVELLAQLWTVTNGQDLAAAAPSAGHVTAPRDDRIPASFYRACGYHLSGDLLVRMDILDRLGQLAQNAGRAGNKGAFAPDHAMLSLLGLSREDVTPILRTLGYRPLKPSKKAVNPDQATTEAEILFTFRGRSGNPGARNSKNNAMDKSPAAGRRNQRHEERREQSPFAALAKLKSASGG